jgi:predicted dehydrogenase
MVRIIGRLKNDVIFSIDPSYANNERREYPRKGVKNPKPVEVFMTAVGTKGTIVADLYGKTFCSQKEPTGDYYCAGLGSSGLWNRRTAEFYHCIRNGRKPTVGLREHYNSIRAMNAAYESIRLGEAVKLD